MQRLAKEPVAAAFPVQVRDSRIARPLRALTVSDVHLRERRTKG